MELVFNTGGTTAVNDVAADDEMDTNTAAADADGDDGDDDETDTDTAAADDDEATTDTDAAAAPKWMPVFPLLKLGRSTVCTRLSSSLS